jgi:hypothetical protein
MKRTVETHGEPIHGKSVESHVVTEPGGQGRCWVAWGNEHFNLSDVDALLKALRDARVAAALGCLPTAPVAESKPARCLDETVGPCRQVSNGVDWPREKWCDACRANGSPLPAVGRP